MRWRMQRDAQNSSAKEVKSNHQVPQRIPLAMQILFVIFLVILGAENVQVTISSELVNISAESSVQWGAVLQTIYDTHELRPFKPATKGNQLMSGGGSREAYVPLLQVDLL